MPKKANELTAVAVKKLTKPGLLATGGVAGLSLQVTTTGASSWILRVMVGLKRRALIPAIHGSTRRSQQYNNYYRPLRKKYEHNSCARFHQFG